MKTIAALMLVLLIPMKEGEWEIKKNKEGIKLYTRKVDGSQMKAIKALTTFHAPLENCVAVLRDIEHLNELFPDCKKVVKVEQDATSQIHYLQLEAPWPVTDRDGAFGLEYSYDADKNSVTVEARMVEDAYPDQDGFVRLNKGGGKWIFTYVDDEHTQLEYYYHGDPGGNIPAWLANSVVEDNPYRMLLNFHSLVEKERYKGKSFSFIK